MEQRPEPAVSTASESTTCQWPGCTRARRSPASTKKTGRKALYCEQPDEITGTPHNASNMYARSRREEAEKTGTTVSTAQLASPYSMARGEASLIADKMAAAARTMAELSGHLDEQVTVMRDMKARDAEMDSIRREAGGQVRVLEDAARSATARAEAAEADKETAWAAADEMEAERDAAKAEVQEMADRLAAQDRAHATELQEVRAAAEQAATEAREAAETRVREATEQAEAAAAAVRDQADRDVAAAIHEKETAVAQARREREEAAAQASAARANAEQARRDASAAQAQAQAATAEASRAREDADRALRELRADFARERDELTAQIEHARDDFARERAQLTEQAHDWQQQTGRLTQDLERERVQAHEDREEMRALYEGQLADTRAALTAEQGRTARLEAQIEELRRAGGGEGRQAAAEEGKDTK